MSATPGVEPVTDPEAVRWFAERLWSWEERPLKVGAIVPEGFEAYGRLLHPAFGPAGDTPWSQVAAWSGKALHPGVDFEDLATRPDGARWSAQGGERPSEELDRELCAALAGVLARSTATPEPCWYGIWNGYGGLLLEQPALEITRPITDSGRRYFLFRGPLDAVTTLEFELRGPGVGQLRLEGADGETEGEPPIIRFHAPNFWWPGDRAWFLSCEIDGPSTYIGGSKELIDRLLADPRLEVMPARLDDPFEGIRR